jgi:hypothetical protein
MHVIKGEEYEEKERREYPERNEKGYIRGKRYSEGRRWQHKRDLKPTTMTVFTLFYFFLA